MGGSEIFFVKLDCFELASEGSFCGDHRLESVVQLSRRVSVHFKSPSLEYGENVASPIFMLLFSIAK